MNELNAEQWLNMKTRKGLTYIYFYTPLCGTCQLATKMLDILEETIPSLNIYKCNLNYCPEIAKQYEIASVPCFTIWKNGQIIETIYAFQSIHFLYDIVKKYESK